MRNTYKCSHTPKIFYEVQLSFTIFVVPGYDVYHLQVHRNPENCHICRIPASPKMADEISNLDKKDIMFFFVNNFEFWGCGCTCMYSAFCKVVYFTVAPPLKVT